MSARSFFIGVGLAWADYWHEWRLSFCAIVGLTAVLAPLLMLYAFKFGFVTSIREQLAQDPRVRELQLIGHGEFDRPFFEMMRRWPEVAFVTPSTRFLAATAQLRRSDGAGESIVSEMWPSDIGDPFLPGNASLHDEYVVISQSLREKLKVNKGDIVTARIGRLIGTDPQSVRLPLTISDFMDHQATDRDVMLVSLPLLSAAEDYREGRSVPKYSWPGDAAPSGEDRTYASFRLFAKDIFSVEQLRDKLVSRKLDIQSRTADIQLFRGLDRNRSFLFSAIAGLGIAGCAIGLGMALWASAERKRKNVAILQLMGLPSPSIAVFPVVQAILTATIGTLFSVGIYVVAAPILNGQFSQDGAAHQTVVARIEVEHVAIALGLVLLASVIAATVASIHVLRQQPSEGLRYE